MNIDDILKEVNNRFKLDTVEYTVEYRDELSKDAEDYSFNVYVKKLEYAYRRCCS